jgi:hypothetical protein
MDEPEPANPYANTSITPPPQRKKAGPVRRGIRVLLYIVGAFWLLIAGVFLIFALTNPDRAIEILRESYPAASLFDVWFNVFLYGGIGVGLILIGRRIGVVRQRIRD